MIATCSPSTISGVIPAVPSKSHAHRLLVAAALSRGICHVVCPVESQDIAATVRCLNALGAKIVRVADGYTVTPIDKNNAPQSPTLDCGESGTTLRFLLPVACAVASGATLTGSGRLPSRPIGGLAECLTAGGATLSSGALPLTVGGALTATEYTVGADVSSQYVSGMLFALAALGTPCKLTTKGKAVSRGYTEMTVQVLRLFGKRIECENGVYTLDGGALTSPETVTAEGDWSNAAFMLAAGALCGDVTVTGLNRDSTQRDKEFADILVKMGGSVLWQDNACRVTKSELKAVCADISDIPDLAPILSIVMAAAQGESVMTGVLRLREKESDRLGAIIHNLAAMGVTSRARDDKLYISGGGIKPFAAQGFNDHRMVMSATVAALAVGGSVDDAGAVAKSYPHFFEDVRRLGGKANETI